MGRRGLAAALREAQDDDAAVRAHAVGDLARHVDADREAVVGTLEGALRDPSAPVRCAAALGLADCRAFESIGPLVMGCQDDAAEVRAAHLTALGELGDDRADEAVGVALLDDDPRVRFQAVMAAARLEGDRDRAVRRLLAASADDDPIVAHIAIRMSEALATNEGVDHRVIARAKALLTSEDPRLRVISAVVLGHAGDRSGADVLRAVVEREVITPEADDEAAAIELCGTLGVDAAVGALERRAFQAVYLIRPDPFAWQARVALARLRHPKAVKWIVSELSAWTRERRSLAVAAAGRARLAEARPLIEAMRGAPARADQDAVEEALTSLDP